MTTEKAEKKSPVEEIIKLLPKKEQRWAAIAFSVVVAVGGYVAAGYKNAEAQGADRAHEEAVHVDHEKRIVSLEGDRQKSLESINEMKSDIRVIRVILERQSNRTDE